ncbi:MAG: rRNA (guanosine-2-O-)-methyltransferase RlmB [Verrucomicrobiota bacterium]|jgi:TrmH family RNA methyltransferase
MFESITSLQNDRVKNLVRLRDGGHRRRQSRFIIEGCREFERATAAKWPIETLFFGEDYFRDEDAYRLLETAEQGGIELVRLGRDAFAKVAFRQNPDGILATARQLDRKLPEIIRKEDNLLVVLEGVEKPGNLGAVFRTANAAGCDALILADPVCDPYSPQAIRASQGAFFDLPFHQATSAEVIAFLTERAIQPIVTSPAGTISFWEADLRASCALVMGSEDKGLSEAWLDCSAAFFLPMRGLMDSLNLASMAAIGLFEAVRQRSVASS